MHPGAESDENEVLPNEALALAVAGCILGVMGTRSQLVELHYAHKLLIVCGFPTCEVSVLD